MEHWTLTWSRLIELSSNNFSLPEFGGVYRLSYQSSDGSIYVFYVGQADDIRKRINDHVSQYETNMCIRKMLLNYKCFVRYARVENLRVRDGAERFLFAHYSPTCNNVLPSGSEMIINLDNPKAQ